MLCPTQLYSLVNDIMRTSQLWAATADGHWRSVTCHIPIWVSSNGSIPASEPGGEVPPSDHVLISQIDPDHNACAVLLRPDQATLSLRINGRDVSFGGLQLLRHGDRVSVDGREFWVSVRATPDHGRYDAELHGAPAYCARTKAPLQSGDEIVVCRGRPDRDCGLLFTADAWAAGIPCHECGATVEGPEWSPPNGHRNESVEELLRHIGSARQPASQGS